VEQHRPGDGVIRPEDAMPLTNTAFEGFDLATARDYLALFDARTRKKGEAYFQRGAVKTLECNIPGQAYLATVQGSLLYEVEISYDDLENFWEAECSCPIGMECKHIYATMKQLVAACTVAKLPVPGAKAAPPEKPAAPPMGFAAEVQKRLGRNLANDENRYVRNIGQLFRQAVNGGLHYQHQLTGLGLPPEGINYWAQLELYPKVPRDEAELWNYLALYLTEKLGRSIPDFMEPVTDLSKAREAMQKHLRAREIERWTAMLDGGAYGQAGPVETAVTPTELRVRFLKSGLVFEWRPGGGGDWTEMKPRKANDFETKYAPGLSSEASLLWLSFLQRVRFQYVNDFSYDGTWVSEQLRRWLRQPLLRPLLVDEDGQPLVFHEAPLRWDVAQPENSDGDYSFSLVQADGQPLPALWLAIPGKPAMYLTNVGVFTGPPFEHCVLPGRGATLIPARAFESAAGLRLLERLQAPPPPRLAARLHTVKLHPAVRAEVKVPWAGFSEYCYLDVYGASEDGQQAEYWTANGWMPKDAPAGQPKADDFVRLDRSGLDVLIPPLDQSGFKWEYNLRRWEIRVTKKFPEMFVAFLKALPAGIRIDLGGELASFQNAQVAGKIRLEATETDTDWFDLRVIVNVDDTTLTPEEIKLLLDAKGKWVRLDRKGWRKLEFALSAEEDRELARLGLTPHELTSEPQRLHAFQLADRAARKFLPEETCERIERRAAELQARVTPDLPPEIRAEMRPYQLEGFHFLAYLSANRFGGILADDMGLGKTVQTLAWLAWLRNGAAAESANGQPATTALPSLVVCPKSVTDNWHAEAAKFFPDLKVRVWPAGEIKSCPDQLASADLHVLNYSQLRLVGQKIARQTFLAVILDEGQYIKNPSSLTAQAARQLRGRHRLVLSGTPIENRLLDLWSLMNFAMPGALGNRAEFGRLYDAKNDPLARQRLSARVRPFLIRRTKAQVARDLPDRVEDDLYCELEGEQKTLYRAELKRAQAMLLGVKTAAALNKQRFNFLTSLLRLRQICCHPRLVKSDSKAASAKLDALFETLEPLIEEGEKVLVFSQFVELLDILRSEVKRRQWKHWYLAGDTENRGDLVREFQAAEGAGVFLISLKAGGFGLNLTAASYVVLFDPWWNPAVENQAIDRTHRIGQDRKVIAYRLLIKDSIEEKIRALQHRKSSLADEVLGEEKFSQSLSLDELRFLLAD
jgi:hypothetical protein